MTKSELIDNLGTIAASGTEKFMEALQAKKEEEENGAKIDLDVIGQFGIGFYSVFMVADEVRVRSKSYLKDEPAFEWKSTGSGKFSLEPIDKEDRGTEIIIKLSEEDEEYLQSYRVESIIKKYSNFISFPIFVAEIKPEEEEEDKKEEKEDVADAEVVGEEKSESVDVEMDEGEADKEEEKEKEPEKPKPVNEILPLWRRDKSTITDEDYQNFYQFISKRYDK